MEHFAQTNVFVRIRTVFARIRTVFAHLIIGCAIRYPKIGCLRYNEMEFGSYFDWNVTLVPQAKCTMTYVHYMTDLATHTSNDLHYDLATYTL